ncbi:hypothetical protein H257_16422 [Aphanomyces astaci]|uniref:Uncharacterized protein n=1 Tax=Aphanomyces astaci TaxID=112090 RepID=W4FKH6_APHAT|nr:hypothetical protein H257_16422 [Aphanomyces astaci]ETV67339.1 hypothetical protein H257_16422 [Aphanomyces astaci]|eukprot:XP_009843154.1 hypothetical protein H257_16422 [Aphanomyces astaci]
MENTTLPRRSRSCMRRIGPCLVCPRRKTSTRPSPSTNDDSDLTRSTSRLSSRKKFGCQTGCEAGWKCAASKFTPSTTATSVMCSSPSLSRELIKVPWAKLHGNWTVEVSDSNS